MIKGSQIVYKISVTLIISVLLLAMTIDTSIKIDSPPSGIHIRKQNLYIKGSVSDKSVTDVEVILDGATTSKHKIKCKNGYFDANLMIGAGKTSVSAQALIDGSYIESGIVVFRDCSVSCAVDSRDVFVNSDTRNLAHPVKIISGRAMVPIREFAGFFGAEVSWDGVNREIVVTLGKLESRIKLNSNQGVIDGVNVACDPPATSIFGASYVPSRFFAQMVGGGVSWDGSTKRITIGVP